MIIISQIKIPVPDKKRSDAKTRTLLFKKAVPMLRVSKEQVVSLTVLRHALDARKKDALCDVYSVGITLRDKQGRTLDDRAEEKLVGRLSRRNITAEHPASYQIPRFTGDSGSEDRPVIVGSGPAGLLCAFALAESGFRPVLVERGKDVTERTRDVRRFFETGSLLAGSNIQFGEGGAGTFSDGKLYTGGKDREGLFTAVKQIFVRHGAPDDILYEAHPHIGTDRLCDMVSAIRNGILARGGSVFFESEMTGLLFRENGAGLGREVCGIVCGGKEFRSSRVVLAIGHSARDTFLRLEEAGVCLEPKPFAVGVRIIHPQSLINRAMYGEGFPGHLEAAAYKQAVKTSDGRSVYTFCMCPGGYVVNASSEQGALCVNGMSYRDRAGDYANSAVICAVSPGDFRQYGKTEQDPLAGIRFQEELEKRAFQLGGGAIPVQTLEGFLHGAEDGTAKQTGTAAGVSAAVKGATRFAPVHTLLPADIRESLAEGIRLMGQKIPGFDTPDALICGVESRTSSPVRIVRDAGTLQAVNIRGLYPCGEGAGYAGGILSSAADGLRVARAIAEAYSL